MYNTQPKFSREEHFEYTLDMHIFDTFHIIRTFVECPVKRYIQNEKSSWESMQLFCLHSIA